MFKSRESLLAWAAGLFDGEGTIYSSNNRVRVSIHMTDLDILETFQSNFGGTICKCKKQKEHHKDSWRWSIQTSVEAASFLNEIMPFYIVEELKEQKKQSATTKL